MEGIGKTNAQDTNDTANGALNVDLQRAAKLVEESYKLFDRDKDGFVTKREMRSGIESSDLTDEQELVFSTIAEFKNGIQTLSDDEFLPDVSGMTLKDFKKLGSLDGKNGTAAQNKLAKEISETLARGLDVHDPIVFKNTGLKHFNEIDQNNSGGIDKLELEAFLERQDISDRAREVESVVLERFDDMTHMARPNYLKNAQARSLNFYMYDRTSTSEISRQDFENLADLRLTPQSGIDSAKSREYGVARVHGGVICAAGAALTIVGVAAAIAPEPAVSKTIAVGSIGVGGATTVLGGAMLFGRTNPSIEQIYNEVSYQRKAIDGWNYFSR